MPQFDANFYYSQVFWLAIIFSCLHGLIHKFIIPLAKKISDSRQSIIDFNISNAEKLASEAKKLQKQYDNEVKIIQELVVNIQKQASNRMEEIFLAKKNQLNNDLKAQINQTNNDIKEDYKLFWANINQSCIDLATKLIEQITNQPANQKLLTKLYDKIK
ncbi:MAG: ATP F0F1 synthase subunit B' [Rickettsia endosymbiont of Bryobia graminum]|nr:ATP F0F1 synthase subunit B' [Rickettsia endosymbiont of Bryobia graminum]